MARAVHNPVHTGEAEHHGHSHRQGSQHTDGHHLLQVENLSIGFRMYDPSAPFFSAKQEYVQVIEDLSISVHTGEIVAVVGASGSGKTLLADCIMGLFEPNATVAGSIFYDGVEQTAESLAVVRGSGISLVPQSVDHLNPLMRVGKQVEGPGRGKGRGAKGSTTCAVERARRREELFERYGLAPDVAQLYPHELSGGMARRVLLCCALMDDPELIIADEPTPGLDLDLAVRALEDFRAFADAGGGVMLITHDIELALRVADRVAVFKDGTIIEETSVDSFQSPDMLRHPFTKALWHALPEHGFCAPVEEEAQVERAQDGAALQSSTYKGAARSLSEREGTASEEYVQGGFALSSPKHASEVGGLSEGEGGAPSGGDAEGGCAC